MARASSTHHTVTTVLRVCKERADLQQHRRCVDEFSVERKFVAVFSLQTPRSVTSRNSETSERVKCMQLTAVS